MYFVRKIGVVRYPLTPITFVGTAVLRWWEGFRVHDGQGKHSLLVSQAACKLDIGNVLCRWGARWPRKISLLISQVACKLLNIHELPCRGKIRYKCLRPTKQFFCFLWGVSLQYVSYVLCARWISVFITAVPYCHHSSFLFFVLAEKQDRFHIDY